MKKSIPMWIGITIFVVSLAITIATFPGKEVRVDASEYEMVQAKITDVELERVRSGKYSRKNKYTVIYEYEGQEYPVVYYHTFYGRKGMQKEMCLYQGTMYDSYEDLEHSERIKSIPFITKVTCVMTVFAPAMVVLYLFMRRKRRS